MTTPPVPVTRILLVDDHAVIRTGLRMLLENQPGFTVIGEAGDETTALDLAGRMHPDIILLDLDLGSTSSLTFLPELLTRSQPGRVILLTGSRDGDIHVRAVQLGAMGVVLKDEAADVLVTAIEKVSRGEGWLDPTLTARLLRTFNRPSAVPALNPETAKIAELTEREREVIALLAQGVSNKDLGQQLHITENTVRRHLAAIFEKLGVENRLELVIYAFRHGLAKPPG